MNIRVKTALSVGLIAFIVFTACHLEATLIFVPSFAEIERKDIEERLEQAVTVINSEVAELDSKVADWAWWDDTYQFMQNHNEAYIENNLMDDVFVNLKLNFMMFINTSGQIVYVKAYNYIDKQPLSDVEWFVPDFLEKIAWWNFSDPTGSRSGIVVCSGNIALASAKPILTSRMNGPVMGTLIFGRVIDEATTMYFSKMIGLEVNFVRYADPQSTADAQNAKTALSKSSPITVKAINDETVAGYALLNDVYANPAVILKIKDTREIYTAGVGVSNFYLYTSLLLCIILSVALMVLIEKAVLIPIRKLTKSVNTLANTNKVDHIKIGGKDETSILADAVKNTLAQRLKAIEELAKMVGHDLRNPLQSITAAVYYIKSKCGSNIDENCKKMLKIIEDSVDYSNKIVDDLLSYSGQVTLYRTETTPKALIADVVEAAKIPSNVQLVDLTDDSPKLYVDVTKLKRAFLNLIRNAVDAMPQGGKLIIKSEKAKGFINISFEDTGTGMPKEVVDKMGEPLFTTKAKGIGLGFPIAKRFVEAHGGSIIVKSTEGKGTTITVQLPTS